MLINQIHLWTYGTRRNPYPSSLLQGLAISLLIIRTGKKWQLLLKWSNQRAATLGNFMIETQKKSSTISSALNQRDSKRRKDRRKLNKNPQLRRVCRHCYLNAPPHLKMEPVSTAIPSTKPTEMRTAQEMTLLMSLCLRESARIEIKLKRFNLPTISVEGTGPRKTKSNLLNSLD